MTAEAYVGTKVNEAMVTVPAYFNDSQRQATKQAEASSPTVLTERELAAQLSLPRYGGGTLDVSRLTIEDGILR